MAKLQYKFLDVEYITKMQDDFYKEHETKFKNIVDIWKINRKEHLKDVKRVKNYLEKYNR